MYRLTPLTDETMTPEQLRVADAIRSGPRGGMRGPFDAWLRSPGLAEPAQELGAYCRFGTSLERDTSELAILLTGRRWRAQFEFWAHARLARDARLPDGVIEAIRVGERPKLDRPDLAVIYDVVAEYFASERLSGETYNRAIEVLGERGLVDLIGIVGYYSLVSMTLNVFQVGLPEGETEPLD